MGVTPMASDFARPHAPSSSTPCPQCQQREVVLGTLAGRFVYLRCSRCHHVWAIPERRELPRVTCAPQPQAGFITE